MNLAIFAALLALLVCVAYGIVIDFQNHDSREKSAYRVGYELMRSRLLQPYCGPDPGYDPVLVETSYASILEKCVGEDFESKAFMRGMLEAVTEYEREHGAP